MHAPAWRRQPSVRSRTLSYTNSPSRHARAGRGLGHFISGVLHGVSGAVHDLLKGAAKVVPKVVEHLENAVNPSRAGHDSGSGIATGTETRQEPHPTVDSVSGSASQQPSRSVSPLVSSTFHSSEYTTVSPTPAPSTSASSTDGSNNVWSNHSSGLPLQAATYPWSPISRQYGSTATGITLAPSSTASTTQSSITMDTPPRNTSGASAEHSKGFPLAAAAAIGSIIGFLVVSAVFWAVWLYLRKRRRAIHAVYLPPKRMLSVSSGRTMSTVPLFISASEAGVKDDSKNPFRHPLDVEEEDPFDAASLWRSSTTRSASTLPV